MRRFLGALVALAGLVSPPAAADALGDGLARLSLPAGFRVELYARVPGARTLAVSRELGAVIVGTRAQAIYAVPDSGLAGRPGRPFRIKDGLVSPNGIAWREGHLYVAERHRIVRYRGEFLEDLAAARPEVLYDGLPDKPHHGWRYGAIGPDGNLYVAIGSPCNICRGSGIEGTIVRLPLTGGEPQVFVRGVRNPVGLDFQPGSGVLHFTDNGADGMGDDSPPDELNRAPRAGLHFGFPWFGGGADRTPDFAREILPGPTEPPVVAFGAHVAALGLDFYEGSQFPAEYRGDAFVAQHGSWNRSVPDGYRVVRIRFDADGKATGYTPFIGGFLMSGGKPWGRPVDIEELPDGSLLVSDDHAGAIYRVSYAP